MQFYEFDVSSPQSVQRLFLKGCIDFRRQSLFSSFQPRAVFLKLATCFFNELTWYDESRMREASNEWALVWHVVNVKTFLVIWFDMSLPPELDAHLMPRPGRSSELPDAKVHEPTAALSTKTSLLQTHPLASNTYPARGTYSCPRQP